MILKLLFVAFIIWIAVVAFTHTPTGNHSSSSRVKNLTGTSIRSTTNCKLVLLKSKAVADHQCSPGLSTNASRNEICVTGYSARHRNVTEQTKREIYAEYGIEHRARFNTPGSYEIDHIVPLELGGSNDPRNLFPQPYPFYVMKDHMEDFMRDEVCDHGLKLASAQQFFVRQYVR